MPQAMGLQGEFTWSGTLEETSVEAVVRRCQRVRLTGRLRLTDEQRQQEFVWLGGEPADADAGDATQDLLRWKRGAFFVSQHIPDLGGQLTEGVELSGELDVGQVQRIAQLCSDFRLSADLHLERSTGDRAQVRFTHGRVESASIAGQPQMAMQALSLLAVWHRGSFRVRLRPLFGEDTLEAPIFSEKSRSKGDFDVTGTIDLAGIEASPRRSRPLSAPVLWPGMAGPPTDPSAKELTGVPEVTRQAVLLPARRSPWARAALPGLAGCAIAVAVVMAGRAWQGRAGLETLPAGGALGGAPGAPTAPWAAPRLAPREPAPPGEAQQTPRSPEVQAQLERALRLLLEGRIRTAQDVLAQLRRKAPGDAEVALAERQARGELGRAEIVVVGSGQAAINGHNYAAPQRLRVLAGLHVINGEMVRLADGESRQVEARP